MVTVDQPSEINKNHRGLFNRFFKRQYFWKNIVFICLIKLSQRTPCKRSGSSFWETFS